MFTVQLSSHPSSMVQSPGLFTPATFKSFSHFICVASGRSCMWNGSDTFHIQEVFQRSNSVSIGSMLMDSQLRWSGHIACMPDYRLPKRVFFGELCSGNGSLDKPRKLCKDTLKVALKKCHIEPESKEVRVSNHQRIHSTNCGKAQEVQGETEPPLQSQLSCSECGCQSYAYPIVKPVPWFR